MPLITTDYKLAVGHNNAAGLTAITSITDGTLALTEPLQLPFYTRGLRRNRTDGRISYAGMPSTVLVFSYLTISQWAYLRTTYEGLVTARLALASTTFANYNGVLVLPDPSELEYGVIYNEAGVLFNAYRSVQVQLNHLEAL